VRHKKSALKNNTAAAAAVFCLQFSVYIYPNEGRDASEILAGRGAGNPGHRRGKVRCAAAEREPGRIDPAARSNAPGELTVAPEQQPPQASV
jgi:hypothetical protein